MQNLWLIARPIGPCAAKRAHKNSRALKATECCPWQVNKLGKAHTAVVGPEQPSPDKPAFILLHGFDGSHLEFRRLHPLLSQLGDVYAVDLAGWGFTDVGAAENPDVVIGGAGRWPAGRGGKATVNAAAATSWGLGVVLGGQSQ
jgi:pimeloyl-ACP methyl ester carboxylesterase